MRKKFSVLALVFVLCSAVFAGDIPSPPAHAPDAMPTPPVTIEVIDNPPGAPESFDDPIIDGLAEAALNVLHIMLALF